LIALQVNFGSNSLDKTLESFIVIIKFTVSFFGAEIPRVIVPLSR